MAITKVRAQFDGTWYDLVYDEKTRTYQALMPTTVFSAPQPGGYYNITVEATNDTGVTATADGKVIPGLQLVVLETVPPTLTLVKPLSGYVTTNTPAITAAAIDDAEGSGINPESGAATLDGEPVPSNQIKATAGENGAYTIVYTPSPPLTEGEHTITLSISDNDGNTSSITADYIVDTISPALETNIEFVENVTDAYTVKFTGRTSDVSNPVTVKILNNGVQVGEAPVNEDGTFEYVLDLLVGENNIGVRAVDDAGLTTTHNYYIIRLITDRIQRDADRVIELLRKLNAGTATQEEINEWKQNLKGAYTRSDLQRVNTAMKFINTWMSAAGCATGFVDQAALWTMEHLQMQNEMATYLNSAKGIGNSYVLPGKPVLPSSIVDIDFTGANSIEKVLVLADKIRPLLNLSPFYSGEISCGEV